MLEGTLSGDTYATTAKYVWEGNSYYDPLLFAYEGAAWKHPMYDGLGSTRQLLDNADQDVTDEYAYEAFGNLMSSTGSTPNPYRYVGSLGYYQTGSSLQHLGARYYLREIGRFTGFDPSRAEEHHYMYAMNSPTIFVDPAGLCIHLPWNYCIGKSCKGDSRCRPKNKPKPKPPAPKPPRVPPPSTWPSPTRGPAGPLAGVCDANLACGTAGIAYYRRKAELEDMLTWGEITPQEYQRQMREADARARACARFADEHFPTD